MNAGRYFHFLNIGGRSIKVSRLGRDLRNRTALDDRLGQYCAATVPLGSHPVDGLIDAWNDAFDPRGEQVRQVRYGHHVARPCDPAEHHSPAAMVPSKLLRAHFGHSKATALSM